MSSEESEFEWISLSDSEKVASSLFLQKRVLRGACWLPWLIQL